MASVSLNAAVLLLSACLLGREFMGSIKVTLSAESDRKLKMQLPAEEPACEVCPDSERTL